MNKPLKVYTSVFISVFTAIATTASSHFTGTADMETVHPSWWHLLLEIIIKAVIMYCCILAVEDGLSRIFKKKEADDSTRS